MYEKTVTTESAEETAAIFGNYDKNAEIIEKIFSVSVGNRISETTAGDCIIIRGEEQENVRLAAKTVETLLGMAKLGTEIGFSPASTAGRVRIMRENSLFLSAALATATARKVLPVPAGPTPMTIVFFLIASIYFF